MSQEGSSGGLFASCRRLAETALALFQTRLELFAVEFQEEKQRFVVILICAGLAIGCSWLAMTMITITVVYLFWESARLVVLGGFSLLYLGLALLCVRAIVVRLRRGMPFNATIGELKKDRECLRTKS